jgi:hypothetical protein
MKSVEHFVEYIEDRKVRDDRVNGFYGKYIDEPERALKKTGKTIDELKEDVEQGKQDIKQRIEKLEQLDDAIREKSGLKKIEDDRIKLERIEADSIKLERDEERLIQRMKQEGEKEDADKIREASKARKKAIAYLKKDKLDDLDLAELKSLPLDLGKKGVKKNDDKLLTRAQSVLDRIEYIKQNMPQVMPSDNEPEPIALQGKIQRSISPTEQDINLPAVKNVLELDDAPVKLPSFTESEIKATPSKIDDTDKRLKVYYKLSSDIAGASRDLTIVADKLNVMKRIEMIRGSKNMSADEKAKQMNSLIESNISKIMEKITKSVNKKPSVMMSSKRLKKFIMGLKI